MSKGGASATPRIDYNQLAATQGQVNSDAAVQQSILNNARTSSPLGTSNWEYVTPPGGGTPRWELTQSLSPQSQNVLNTQQNLVGSLGSLGTALAPDVYSLAAAGGNLGANVAGSLASQVPGGPLSFAGLTPLPTSATDFGNEVGQAQKAAYNTQTGFLDPQFAQKQSDLTQQLADQGVNPGTAAYDRAQGDLGRQETLAYQQAQDAAVQAGNQEQAQLFGENLQSRQQGANEALQAYQSVPNLISSLAGSGAELASTGGNELANLGSLGNFNWASGLPTYGGSPTTVQTPNVVQAGQVGNTSALNQFASGNILNNELFKGLGSLGGVAGLSSGGLGGLIGSFPSSTVAGLTGAEQAGLGIPGATGGSGFLGWLGSLFA